MELLEGLGRRLLDRGLGGFLLSLSVLTGTPAHAGGVAFAGTDVPSVFFISKSDDRNQVHYGIRLDSGCRPRGDEPVVAYWKLNERGGETKTLSLLDRLGYAVKRQRLLPNGSLQMEIRGFPRPIDIEASPDGSGGCSASATTSIANRRATLDEIHLLVATFMSVSWIQLSGHDPTTKEQVREKVYP